MPAGLPDNTGSGSGDIEKIRIIDWFTPQNIVIMKFRAGKSLFIIHKTDYMGCCSMIGIIPVQFLNHAYAGQIKIYYTRCRIGRDSAPQPYKIPLRLQV